jgi:hypothetical protein
MERYRDNTKGYSGSSIDSASVRKNVKSLLKNRVVTSHYSGALPDSS